MGLFLNDSKTLKMKYLILLFGFLISANSFAQSIVSAKELNVLTGNWEGTITYLDYQTNKPFTMPANLLVEKGKKDNCLILNNIYPNEPKANNSEKFSPALTPNV